jgi:hypothetical protein
MTAPPSETHRLTNGVVELHVPAAYGPRVSHYGFVDGPNVFGDGAGAQRETASGVWRAYGGHRLWVAPERFPQTYTIDDDPPRVESSQRRLIAHRRRDPVTELAVTIDVELQPAGTDVVVRHVVRNDGSMPQRLAPWAISVLQPGGVALVPNAERRSAREALTPARTLALWHYTDLTDPRLHFGEAFLRVRCVPEQTTPFKIGVACERGWSAYVVGGTGFVVRAPYDGAADYPDRGSSVEIYTEGGVCELETLGPLRTLQPRESAHHVERWSLVAGIDADDDASLARALGKHAET